MAWGKKKKALDDEYEDEYEEEDDGYEDEYEEKKAAPVDKFEDKDPKDDYDDDDDDYDDDYDDDDYEDEPKRNGLKGVVVVLVILALLLAAAAALFYLRMKSAESKVEQLNTALNTAQTELNRLQAEAAAAAAAPVVTPAPVAAATPEPAAEATPEPAAPEVTPEPAATEATPEPAAPEVTPEPAPAAVSAPKDTTDEMLAGVTRPQENCWLAEAKQAWANSFMVASHWGPGLQWFENMALVQNDKVDVLAEQDGWSLVKNQNGKYGWVLSTLLTETAPAG